MSVTITDTVSDDSLVSDQIYTAVRAWLLSIVPNGVEVVKGQDNRVSSPGSDNFIAITPQGKVRLSSNLISYDRTANTRTVTTHSSFDVQIDVYGDNSSNIVQAIEILARDDSAFDNAAFAALAGNIIDITEPNQVAWDTPEQQYEERWTCTLTLQANVGVTMQQDFAAELEVNRNSL